MLGEMRATATRDMLVQDFLSKMNGFDLSASNRQELDEAGFTIIPGPLPVVELVQLAATYNTAVNNAISDDVRVGSSTTRVRDFVNRGPEFDRLYVHPPVLKACCYIIDKPFKLSTMHARTLQPGLPGPGSPCRLRARQSRLDNGRFHFHDRRVPKRQRCDSIRAGLTPVVRRSTGPFWRPEGRLSRASSGLRSGGFHGAIQRFRLAWTHSESV